MADTVCEAGASRKGSPLTGIHVLLLREVILEKKTASVWTLSILEMFTTKTKKIVPYTLSCL